MNPIIQRITENRLNDFKGLAIEGEIPISEEVLNDLLQLFLHKKKKTKSTSSEKDSINISEIFDSLDENDIKIELKEKKAVLKVTARKY